MDLNNTIRKDNLVILKKGVRTQRIGTANQTEFKVGKFYRSIVLINGNHKEAVVYGELFVNEEFDNLFEFAYDKIIRDFKGCGLFKTNGKPISKTKFKELCDIRKYGKRGLYKGYILMNNNANTMYCFKSNFLETKKTFIDCAYSNFIDICNGILDSVDNKLVQFGDSGISLSYNINLRMR